MPDGLGLLVRLALRRDRVRLAVAAVAVGGLVAASAQSVRSLYPTHAELASAAAGLAATPAGLAVYGPAADLDTVGGLTLWKPGGLVLVVVALLCVLTVTRHSRADEEEGRAELVGAGAVARSAPLVAAVLVAGLEALLVAVVCGLGLAAVAGSMTGALGAALSFLSIGLAFTGVAAVTAQLAQSARAATGLALTALGAAYGLRAVGDAAHASGAWGGWLSDLSPIGWVQLLRPYDASPRWWVLALPLVLAVVTVLAALGLRARRDLGAGVLRPRPGPARAGGALVGGWGPAFGLAWRLQRGVLAAWAAGLALLGLLMGALASSVSDLVGDSQQVRDLFDRLGGHQGLADAYLATTMSFVGLAVAAYAVSSVLRLRGEEAAGRLEPVLAGAVGRGRAALAHWSLAAVGAAGLALVVGLAAGAASAARASAPGDRLAAVLAAALAQVPAAWVVAAVAAVLVAVAPRAASAGWLALVLAALLGELGELLRLPSWLRDLSPYTHVPHLPAASVAVGAVVVPVAALTAVAVAALAVALLGLRRRDIPA